MGHVADRVDVDEEADAGDDGEHDHGEVVDGEREVDLEAGDLEPGAERFGDGERCVGAAHHEPDVGHDAGGDGGEEQRDGRDGGARKAAAQGSVEQEAGEGAERDEPEEIGVHGFRWGSFASGLGD